MRQFLGGILIGAVLVLIIINMRQMRIAKVREAAIVEYVMRQALPECPRQGEYSGRPLAFGVTSKADDHSAVMTCVYEKRKGK